MIINQNVVKMTLDQQSAVIRSWMNIYTVHRPVGQLYKEQKCFWSTYRILNLVGELLKMPFFSCLGFLSSCLAKSPEKSHLGEKGFLWLTVPGPSPSWQGSHSRSHDMHNEKQRAQRACTPAQLSSLSPLHSSQGRAHEMMPPAFRMGLPSSRAACSQPNLANASLRPLPRWVQTVSSYFKCLNSSRRQLRTIPWHYTQWQGKSTRALRFLHELIFLKGTYT